jgi:Rrf2 family protein
MKLLTQVRYSIRVLLDLSMNQREGMVQMSEVASRQNISHKYLERIIQPLKDAGFVISKRGRNGGHTLAMPPEAVSLADIVRIFDTDAVDREFQYGLPGYQDALIRDAWQDAKQAFYDRLSRITLADLSIDTTKKLWSDSEILIFCE